MKSVSMILLLCALMSNTVYAGPADVLDVEVKSDGPLKFQFFVSVRHADEGWDHYANRWDVVTADGTVLATRTLHHPHQNEQPFTRSLGGVKIPDGITTVTVRAQDSLHGYGGKTITIQLPR